MTPMTAPPTDAWTFEAKVHFGTAARGRKRLVRGEAPPPAPVEPGSVPRVTRLLALAHRFDGLVRDGTVADQTDLARLAGVTRQRICQIMSLLRLAPDIQEALIDLPRTHGGRDPVLERHLRPIVAQPLWSKQRALWRALRASTTTPADRTCRPPERSPPTARGVAPGEGFPNVGTSGREGAHDAGTRPTEVPWN